MNRSFNEGISPDSWKVANIVPIFKKGDKYLPSNHLIFNKTGELDRSSFFSLGAFWCLIVKVRYFCVEIKIGPVSD